ncbi:SDR family oxidoreductase [Chitinophaga tropicalis]|uniref:SDR family NAD(P)-dependent oxidoreductase n=1 Tax=Chitinophaga tropicalis TaxID=2683588 RepID=A0A7K1TY73_9BACT|nr:SDR family oxidoreductase [Chitinophaga tropicalis]MVT07059.1 SDR family NAD(P)-dependent oxidoreductase [Chitinophaga tropicalis]
MNAVITGASKGIGKAVAIKLAVEGFNVAICARNAATLEQTAEEIRAHNPAIQVLAIPTDMGKKEDVLAFAEKVKAAFNTIDILVNNAGVFVPGALAEQEEGLLENMMAANVYSAYHLTRQLLPGMKAVRKGHIFNMCSTASYTSHPNGGAYSITKFALLGFSRNLREELKSHNVKVTSLSPGPTLTASWEGFDAPPRRMMEPEDVANLLWAAYTLSEQAVVEEVLMRPMLGDIS